MGSGPRARDTGGQQLGFIFIMWGVIPSGEFS